MLRFISKVFVTSTHLARTQMVESKKAAQMNLFQFMVFSIE